MAHLMQKLMQKLKHLPRHHHAKGPVYGFLFNCFAVRGRQLWLSCVGCYGL
jgi:hypothetical protein